jgi:hypothetical protein
VSCKFGAELLRAHEVQVRAFHAGSGRVPDAWQTGHAELLAPFEAEWKRTGNPLWIWRALRIAFRGAEGNIHALPQWIADYLDTTAWKVSSLGIGLDHRGNTPPGPHAPSRRKLRKTEKPSDLLADALGFTTMGRSVFAKDVTDQRNLEAAERYNYWLAQGLKAPEARAKVLEEQSRSDDRWLRRMLKSMGRKVRQPRPRLRPGQ